MNDYSVEYTLRWRLFPHITTLDLSALPPIFISTDSFRHSFSSIFPTDFSSNHIPLGVSPRCIALSPEIWQKSFTILSCSAPPDLLKSLNLAANYPAPPRLWAPNFSETSYSLLITPRFRLLPADPPPSSQFPPMLSRRKSSNPPPPSLIS